MKPLVLLAKGTRKVRYRFSGNSTVCSFMRSIEEFALCANWSSFRAQLHKFIESNPTSAELFDEISKILPPHQIKQEITRFVDVLRARDIHSVIEIGCAQGGNSLLLACALPNVQRFACVDLYVENQRLLRRLVPETTQLLIHCGSSYSSETMSSIRRQWPDPVSCVFVDGDHSLVGVCRDIVAYLPLVEDGGIMAFHDVNGPHDRVNHKVAGSWAGGVPWLWNEIAKHIPNSESVVANPGQEGYGIGWVEVTSASRGVLEAMAQQEIQAASESP